MRRRDFIKTTAGLLVTPAAAAIVVPAALATGGPYALRLNEKLTFDDFVPDEEWPEFGGFPEWESCGVTIDPTNGRISIKGPHGAGIEIREFGPIAMNSKLLIELGFRRGYLQGVTRMVTL